MARNTHPTLVFTNFKIRKETSKTVLLILNYQQPGRLSTIKDSNILLVYYSLTGHTEKIAKLIARVIDCDIEKIEPVIPYTGGLTDIRRRISADPSPAIHELSHNITKYGTVILGMPVWNNNIPGPMSTFISRVDWRGVKIHPFFATGGIFINVYSCIKDKCKGAAVTAPLFLIYNNSGQLSEIKE